MPNERLPASRHPTRRQADRPSMPHATELCLPHPSLINLLEYLRQAHKLVSWDRSIRLPPLSSDEETQHSPAPLSGVPFRRPRTWIRWLANTTLGQASAKRTPATAPTEPLGVHATLRALPTLLDGSSLPNGVV